MTDKPLWLPCGHCRGRGVVPVPGSERDQLAAAAIAAAAEAYGLMVQDIIGPGRSRVLVAARDDVTVQLRGAGFVLKEIGHYLGRRHYSTMIHSLHKKRAAP